MRSSGRLATTTVISTVKARSEVIRYIHRNPVKRGLVERPEDWPWSSFRHYAPESSERSRSNRNGPHSCEETQLPEGVRLKIGERFWLSQLFRQEREGWAFTIKVGHRMSSRRSLPPAHRKQRDERDSATSCDLAPFGFSPGHLPV